VPLLVAAACGVPSADRASTARGSEVPFGLLDEATTTTSTTIPELAATALDVWLVGDQVIVPIAREVAAPASIDRALDALAAGPTDVEATFGLRSVVSTEVIGDAEVVDGVATIDLRDAFATATPRDQLLALAQLVYTATELASVEVVSFTLDGQSVDVPRGDGSISDGPVDRRDYAALTAPPS
jgi:spore germination protein GerM